jgi:hypothetical protein
MNLSKEDLKWAASQGLISVVQAENLWEGLENRSPTRARFDLAHVAYYFGALLVLSAMGWFMTRAWEQFGGGGLTLISSTYALCFVLAGRTLWYKENLRVPGGLLFTLAVGMTPLAIYGVERMTGIWPQGDPGIYRDYYIWVKGSWFLMEVGTILSALIVLKFIHFPFLTAPIAFSLWYMSMDLTPLLFGKIDFSIEERFLVSLWFGLAVLLLAYFVDRRKREDYAFWLYLFGILSFWCGLSLMNRETEFQRLIYGLVNLGLIFISVLLERRVFIVFGALGVFGYLGHLAYKVFQDSMLFPFVVTFIGIGIIYLGIKCQRNREHMEKAIRNLLPEAIRQTTAFAGILLVAGLALYLGLGQKISPPIPATPSSSAPQSPSSQWSRYTDTDLPGSDFEKFALNAALPSMCERECQRNEKCKAYVYVPPGTQGVYARCWLKDVVPQERKTVNGVISAVRIQ